MKPMSRNGIVELAKIVEYALRMIPQNLDNRKRYGKDDPSNRDG
jgi:hypothetical protein